MGHTYSSLYYHVIFSTKNRDALISNDLRPRLHEYMGGLVNGEFGQSIKVGGTENHVHGLMIIRPDIAVSQAMSRWKSLSSGWMNRLDERAGQEQFAWQAGYAAFSVSRSNVEKVERYIENQMEHHRHQTFEEEFIEFLKRHEVDYDPSTVWD